MIVLGTLIVVHFLLITAGTLIVSANGLRECGRGTLIVIHFLLITAGTLIVSANWP